MRKRWPDEKGRRFYKDLQKRLSEKLHHLDNVELRNINTLLAIDVSYKEGHAMVCGVLWDVGKACPFAIYRYIEPVYFPYISGLFFIRELPPIVRLAKKVAIDYDVLLLNAVGAAHPEGIGLATHAGLYLEKPSFGITERIPYGFYEMPEKREKAWRKILDSNGNTIGYVIRSQKYVKPVFVTPGYRLKPETALSLAMSLPFNARLPEPLRLADRCSKKDFKKEVKIRGCENETIHSIKYPAMTGKQPG